MIFLTVGSQLPFDRLTREVDKWSGQHPSHRVVGQVGVGGYVPVNFDAVATMPPEEYQRMFDAATLVVGHAGMGTIIAALEAHKPLLMLPRLGALRESRNDNQVGTARHFARFGLFEVINEEAAIGHALDRMLGDLGHYLSATVDFGVSEPLVDKIRQFANS